MIKRVLKNQIIPLLEFFPCVGILGSRQVGKTTFVKHLKAELNQPILYLDLEDSNDFELLSTNPQWFLEQNSSKLIIIDEIQRELKLFPLLRALIDKTNRAGQFIILGSAMPALLSKSSETLAGRIVYKELTPLNSSEAHAFNQKTHWFRGGYPKALTAPNDKLWFEWHNSYLKTYIEADLRLLGLNISPITTLKLLKMLASIQGVLINYTMLSNALGVSSNMVKHYIDIIEHSYIIRRLEPFYVNIGKRMVKSPKLYIRDTGILHALLQFSNYEHLIAHPIAGNSWEGFVIEQIISQLNTTCTPYFYRTQTGAELDLCLVKGNEVLVCIEIKLSNKPTISRGNTESVRDLNSKHNFIVVFDEADYALNETWRVCDLKTMIHTLKDLNLVEP